MLGFKKAERAANTVNKEGVVDATFTEVKQQAKSATTSKTKKNTVFLDQSYRIPFSFIGRNGTREERKEFKVRRDSIMSSGDSAAIAEFLLEQKQK